MLSRDGVFCSTALRPHSPRPGVALRCNVQSPQRSIVNLQLI